MIKRKKYLKEAENYDIVFTNKKSPAGNEPKGGSCEGTEKPTALNFKL